MVYFAVDVLAAWGLSLQFGMVGLLSFSFIVFQAAGAYTAAVLSPGPDTANGGFQQYIAGASLPFPLPLLAAGVVGRRSGADWPDHPAPAPNRLSGGGPARRVDHRDECRDERYIFV